MTPIQITVVAIACSAIMLGVAIYLLARFNRLFRSIKNEWLRKNLAVLVVGLAFMLSTTAVTSEVLMQQGNREMLKTLFKQLYQASAIVLFVFNVVWLVLQIPGVKAMRFVWHHIVVISTILIAALIMYVAFFYLEGGTKIEQLKATIVFAIYNALATGLIYTAVNYVDLDRKRKLNEKELEVARLTVLKTKAELDALHSKVNPHFLYNALNSIADLSITDGKKARRMTIALADLFRYSINYSQNNYSTVEDELEMTEVYLQIEKIRFEDQLNYNINVEDGARHYLVPRFLLQPLAENAVKHGLKRTGKLTEININVGQIENGLRIVVADNGPTFPEELLPGYGVKSVFDKLDLLFPGEYEIRFSNEPTKRVEIDIYKLIKNEPPV